MSPAKRNRPCLHQLIERQVRKTPDKTAVVFESKALTYRELNEQANQLAHFLRKRGVKTDSVVGVHMGLSLERMVAILGILKAGAAYTPLDPVYPEDRLRYMAANSKAEICLISEQIRQPLCANRPEILFARALSRRPWNNESRDNPDGSRCNSTQLAYVVHTSGSTGRPKGVEVEHHSIVNVLESLAEIVGFSANEVVLSATNLSSDTAAIDIYLTWMKGAELILAPAMDAIALGKALTQSQATLFQSMPHVWQGLLRTGWTAPPGFKALCGGELIPRQLLDDFLSQPLRLWNLYGPTETTILSTACELKAGQRRPRKRISAGRPIANTSIYILDDAMNAVPAGSVGEVCIGGAGVARGYRNQPALTAEKFVPNPFEPAGKERLYKTGDLGRLRPDGQLELFGRKDHQIKLHGCRIEPGEIEFAIKRAVGVESLVVLKEIRGRPDLVAYLMTHEVPMIIAPALSRLVPAHMIPRHYVALPRLPLTASGKVDRNALPLPPVASLGPVRKND